MLTRPERGARDPQALFKALAPAASPRSYRLAHEIFVSGLFGARGGDKLNRRRRRTWLGPVHEDLASWRGAWVRAAARSLVEIEADPAREIILDEEFRRLVAAGRRREAVLRALQRYEHTRLLEEGKVVRR